MSSTEDGADADVDVAEMLDLTTKKKKKKKKDKSSSSKSKSSSSANNNNGKSSSSTSTTGEISSDEQLSLIAMDEARQTGNEHNNNEEDDPYDNKSDYTYPALLDRIMNILHAQNPDLIDKKRRNMKPPQLTRVGTKKTLWVNFQEICTMMQRPPEHVFQFFMAELGTEGSIDGNQRLVIRGKYVPKYIESLLRKYIVEYVTCQMCRSPNTELIKDSVSRLHFNQCKDCGSRRSVAAIRSGYHATTRADRRAGRNAKA